MGAKDDLKLILWPKGRTELRADYRKKNKENANNAAGPPARVNVRPTGRPNVSTGAEKTWGRSPWQTPLFYHGAFIWKAIFTGTFKLSAPPGVATHQFSAAVDSDSATLERVLVAKYETEISRGLMFEGNAGLTGNEVELISSGKWREAMANIFSGRLKTGGDFFLGSQWAGEVDVTPGDEHACVFGVTGKLSYSLPRPHFLYDLTPVPAGTEYQVEGALEIRFNLSPQAWHYLLQTLGRSALMQVIRSAPSMLGQKLLASFTAAGGAAAAGGTVGAVGFYFGMAWLAATKTKGARLGILTNYCVGYLVRVFEERTKRAGNMTSWKLSHPGEAANMHYIGGYEDAQVAIAEHGGGEQGLNVVESALMAHFPIEVRVLKDSMFGTYLTTERVNMGQHIDREYEEAREIADMMARYMVDHPDEFADFLEIDGVGWSWY